MRNVNFKLETFADPGWNLTFQRESTISKDIPTTSEIYSGDPDLFVLFSKARATCSIDFESLNLEKIRDWYLLVAQDEEWYHKETFELAKWDNECNAYINLDYIFDNYELDFGTALDQLSDLIKNKDIETHMGLEGELLIRLKSNTIEKVVELLNTLVTKFKPKKPVLTLDKNWSIFLEKLQKVLLVESIDMPTLENRFSFNRLSLMNKLNYACDHLQKKNGKERILVEFSTLLTNLKNHPSVGDDMNQQLAQLNRFLALELIDWSKY